MYCSRCGAANPDGADVRYCRSCGGELANPALLAGQPYAGPRMLPFGPPGMMAAGFPAGALQAAVFPYGGFWIRLVAYIIDLVAVAVVGFVLGLTLGFALALVGARSETINATSTVLGIALGLGYYVVGPPALGATPGKLAVGYHIVGEDGRHIGYGRALGRYLAYFLSALPLGLGYIWIGIDSRKRGWHDTIAGTYVVRKEFVRP